MPDTTNSPAMIDANDALLNRRTTSRCCSRCGAIAPGSGLDLIYFKADSLERKGSVRLCGDCSESLGTFLSSARGI